MIGDKGYWPSFGLQLAYASGVSRILARRQSGTGAIIRLMRVTPTRREAFQPLRAWDITPETLDRMIRALRRWGFALVSLDEACRRAVEPAGRERFIAITFDGGDASVIEHAYPVLARHGVPFAVYIPTAFPDGIGESWWLALERLIRGHDRIALEMEGRHKHFLADTPAAKQELFDVLAAWLFARPPQEVSRAIHDLCGRYGVDLTGLSRLSSMDWDAIRRLAADPQVTIGSATVHYHPLTRLSDADSLREISMGRAVLEAALGCDAPHMAFPFGNAGSVGAHHSVMAANAEFASAVTAVAGLVGPDGAHDLHRLPRINWDGRWRSPGPLHALLAGVTLRGEGPAVASS